MTLEPDSENGAGAPPLISVLVPFYNHNQFILECLDSIKALQDLRLELCVINDGSDVGQTQNLEAWIETNRHQIDILYRNRPNKGVTKTLNELVEMSHGDFLYLIASDDYVLPDIDFGCVIQFMSEHSALMCVCDCALVDQYSNIVRPSNAQKNGFNSLEKYNGKTLRVILRQWFFAGAICVYDRRIFGELGGFDESLLVEDWDFFIRAAANNQLVFMDYVISAYRLHDSNAHSSEARKKALFDSLRRTCLKNRPLFGVFDKMYSTVLAAVYFWRTRL